MTTSAKLGIPFISQQQATPEITHNEAILMMSAFQVGVESVGLNTPPSTANEGDCFIVGSNPSGQWANRKNSIAIYFNNGWRFVPDVNSSGTIIQMGEDQAGLKAFNKSSNEYIAWNGSAWIGLASIPAEPMRFGQRPVTINTTPINVQAANDITLADNNDYIQVTGIFNPHPSGETYGVTQTTNGLIINRTGYYRIEFWGNASSSIPQTRAAFRYAVNGSLASNRRPQIFMRNSGDIQSGAAFGYGLFNAGDEITLYIAANQNASIIIHDMVLGVVSLTNGPTTGATELGQLTDVNTTNVNDGDTLVYDLISDSWQTAPISSVPGSSELSKLNDVELSSSLSDGDILVYDSNNDKWINEPKQSLESIFINDIQDVEINSGISDGQILIYDQTNQLWKNGNQQTTDPIADINDIENVEIGINLTDGDILVYDQTLGLWVNNQPNFSNDPISINEITDVEISSNINDGDTLTYDSSINAWINSQAQQSVNELNQLNDVELNSNLINDSVLKYNETTQKWENGNISTSSISDIEITSPDDGQILIFDSVNSRWINSNQTSSKVFTGGIYDDDNTTSAGAYAFKGGAYKSLFDIDIFSIEAPIRLDVLGGEYKLVIGMYDENNIITSISESETFIAPTTTHIAVLVSFKIEYQLIAGNEYFIMVGRTDGSNTYVLPAPQNYTGAGTNQPTPSMIFPISGGARAIASNNPSIGDTLFTYNNASTVVPFRINYTDPRFV